MASIERDARLAQFCRDALKNFMGIHAGFGSRAGKVLNHVRQVIRNDESVTPTEDMIAQAEPKDRQSLLELRSLMDRGREFQRDLILPSRQQPLTLAWKEPDRWTVFKRYVTAPSLCPSYLVLGAIAVVLSALCFVWFGFSRPGSMTENLTFGRLLIAVISGCFGTLLLLVVVIAGLMAKLYWAETHDSAEDFDPDLSRVRELARLENPPGFAQNHFLSVSPLKPGRFRKFTLGIALWGIELLIRAAFRPGFILNMGTIHFARWFRPPGTERLVFLSNYDGSWESYLEDFVTKAHKGQSAAWSNAVDFPRTRLLIGGGAQDGDRFKRWVRRQQKPTQFWFSRFPEHTADHILNNAVIRWGLARAATDSQARAWLSNFGSMPKTDPQLETHEVQGIVFRGFGRLKCMKFVALQLSDDLKVCSEWLRMLRNIDPGTSATFGDRPVMGDTESERTATFVAFSAAGLSHLGIKPEDRPGGLETFPTAFNLGMNSRRRVLGDVEDTDDLKWRWSDLGSEHAAHAVLLIYAEEKKICDDVFERHNRKLKGPHVVHSLDTQPTEKGLDYEHFGFRDGITQPVIRGTQRFAKGAHPRDIMEAGEFLLGYKSNQGFYPPTPTVARDTDLNDRLAAVPASAPTRYSALQNPRPDVRDFGRNGTFLAIRQFEQHVERFHDYAEAQATKLKAIDSLSEVVGSRINGKWVEAKLMGRWHDGTQMIDYPPSRKKQAATKGQAGASARDSEDAGDKRSTAHVAEEKSHIRDEKQPDTDLDFGVDDPQGLFCPIGAHVRRVNPRGSLSPEDGAQLSITNRHRILRRGRPYQSDDEKGLLFVGICADIERQFEFVQQSWLANPAFGGLVNEPDPIAASKKAPGAAFTIPTSAGPLSLDAGESFVTVRGGGYFFLPSRSALRYLTDLAASRATKPDETSAT